MRVRNVRRAIGLPRLLAVIFQSSIPRRIDEREGLKSSSESATEQGRVSDEGWRVRQDGTVFWASVTITAIRDDRGNLIGFGKVTRDLTERQKREESLRQSEERFRLLVSGVQDYAIFMLDQKGYVISWNEGAERIKGYLPEEIIGQHFSRFYPEEDIRSRKTPVGIAGGGERGTLRRRRLAHS